MGADRLHRIVGAAPVPDSAGRGRFEGCFQRAFQHLRGDELAHAHRGAKGGTAPAIWRVSVGSGAVSMGLAPLSSTSLKARKAEAFLCLFTEF